MDGHGIGAEDVLDGDDTRPAPAGPEPLDPSERTRFRRGWDVTVAVLITVAAVVAGLVVWQTSSVRATTSQTNAQPLTTPEQPALFPPSLGEVWRARSAATQVPVAVGPVVVTGEVVWRYSRNLPLCTVAAAWSLALAVYRTDGNWLPAKDSRSAGGCSEVTALDPQTGLRGKQRGPDEPLERPNGGERDTDAELGTRLLPDGTYVTTTGRHLLLSWRSDLVQTMEYGTLPALVNPGKQPRTGCTYGSVAVAPAKVGVIERCPGDNGDRLTVYRSYNNDNKADEPPIVFSVVVGGHARVVALADNRTAVALSDPSRLVVFDETGKQVEETPLDLPAKELEGDPDGLVVPVTKGPGVDYWFTGSRTIALHAVELHPLWTQQGTLGPGVVFAGRELLPVPNGIRVVDVVTGQPVGTFAVDRGSYTGPVMMASIGPMVLEQRAQDLVALR